MFTEVMQHLAASAWEGAAELKVNDMKEEKWISDGF